MKIFKTTVLTLALLAGSLTYAQDEVAEETAVKLQKKNLAFLFQDLLTPTTEVMNLLPTLHLQIFPALRLEWPISFFRMKEKRVVLLPT